MAGAAHLGAVYFDGAFRRFDDRMTDRLLALPGRTPAPPAPGATVVHIDANFYLSRLEHARVIRRLDELGVRLQMLDHLFEGAVGGDDARLGAAISDAGTVIAGVRFEALEPREGGPPVGAGLRRGSTGIGTAARGEGFLNLTPDPDGVLRRVPLVVQSDGALVPSIALRTACELMGLDPHRAVLASGTLLLPAAGAGAAAGAPEARGLAVPVDPNGYARIDFARAPLPVRHLSYSELYPESGGTDGERSLAELLPGSVAILSEKVQGGFTVAVGPLRETRSSGVVQSAVLWALLSGAVLKPAAPWVRWSAEIALLAVPVLLSLRMAPAALVLGGGAAALGFGAAAAVSLSVLHSVLPLGRPLLALVLVVGALLATMTVERGIRLARIERARRLAERELEIGRRIQKGFLPETLPELEGWDIDVYYEPARQVAGDFYDLFPVEGGRRIAVVVADVCDKGVGAALFMALFRSLIRVLSGAGGDPGRPVAIVDTVAAVNDYIARTHGSEGMFATVFIGVLDPETGEMAYVNGGHEPPWVLSGGTVRRRLAPTGPAVGAVAGASFRIEETRLHPGETLLGFTDGLLDAGLEARGAFGRIRLADCIEGGELNARALLVCIRKAVGGFLQGRPLTDDITCVAIRRTGDAGSRPP